MNNLALVVASEKGITIKKGTTIHVEGFPVTVDDFRVDADCQNRSDFMHRISVSVELEVLFNSIDISKFSNICKEKDYLVDVSIDGKVFEFCVKSLAVTVDHSKAVLFAGATVFS